MATVRISQALLNDTEARIRMMHRKQINLEFPDHSSSEWHVITDKFKTALAGLIHDKVWGEFSPEFVEQIPKEWLIHKSEITVKFYDEFVAEPEGPAVTPSKEVEFNLGVDLMLPPDTPWRPRYTCPYNILTDEMRPAVDAMFKQKYRLEKLQDQFDTIRRQVIAFLNHSKSLNAALKAMPELELYVSEHYVERVREKVERQPKAESTEPAKPEVDRGLLAGVAVQQRIRGG